jgi:threonine dehydrogenase-like Zn-dependent dehydrogenase
MGAAKVIVSGRKPFKLEIAKTIGADIVVDATKEDLVESVMRETEGKGVSVVLETSGNSDVINQCAFVVKQFAYIILLGFYEENVKDFDIDKLVTKQAHIQGILGEYGLPQQVMDIMVKSKISLKPLITHRFLFDEAIEAMKTANEKNDTKIKMLVKVSEE